MEFLRDNYLTYSVNDNFLNVTLMNPKLPLGTFYDETIKQVKYINENKTKPINLFLSGGLDSEYTVHVFNALKIDCNVICYRLLGEGIVYNSIDLSYALNICNKLNIKPIIYDFDIEDYIKSGKCIDDSIFYEWTDPNVIHYLTFINVASKFDGCNIWSEEFHTLLMDPARNKFNIRISYNQYKFYQTWKKLNIEGTSTFLSYSSEMLFAFFNDPEIIKLRALGYPGKLSQDSIKAFVYNRGNNFNLEPYNYVTKSRIKLNGHEECEKSELYRHPNLVQIQKPSSIENFKEDANLFLSKYGF